MTFIKRMILAIPIAAAMACGLREGTKYSCEKKGSATNVYFDEPGHFLLSYKAMLSDNDSDSRVDKQIKMYRLGGKPWYIDVMNFDKSERIVSLDYKKAEASVYTRGTGHELEAQTEFDEGIKFCNQNGTWVR